MTPTQWQFRIFGRPAGKWRDTLDEARQDAIDAGYGELDRQYGHFFITVPGELVSRNAPHAGEEIEP